MIDNSRFLFDQKIKKENNVKIISGSDEVGRGAMAGPIVVASVILKDDFFDQRIKDSKLLNEKKREELFELIIENSLSYSIKEYDNEFVDKNNPKKTSQIGMMESIKELSLKPQVCLIDGEKITIENYKTMQLIKGDYKSQSIAAASIIAKVYRDRIMNNYSIIYKGYDFESHKGYCTLKHTQRVKELGVLEIHRKSYKPIKNLIKGE